jgi:valyl-tRNA synthetase
MSLNENINNKFLTPYDPDTTEDRIYSDWEKSGLFNPDTCLASGATSPESPTFSIVLPPPNVTGTLHMGHATMLAIEDIVVRYHRMKGFRTLWIPGTDHAAIATQSKVEKIIEKEGLKKSDMGREAFLGRVNAFAEESHDTIVNQMKKMGSSVDWSREAYTLDEKRNLAVRTAFLSMYQDGLIERGYRVVNFDPKGQTVISDDEIVHEERKAKLYTFRYSKDFPIAISTTRPETKVGDTAVAVHPDDERYKDLIGREYSFEFCGVPVTVKIVADDAVEKEFGTGALGVTPAHAQIDSEIAARHNLRTVPVINEYAKMTVTTGPLVGKKVTEARELVAQWLRDEGLMEKEEEVTQNVSTAERTGGIIEPLPKEQWFIKVNKSFTMKRSKIPGISVGDTVTLKQLMQHVVRNGDIEVLPDRFNDAYFRWIDNLRDWCISRQIWFGHRIPAWFHEPVCTPTEGKPEAEMAKCEPVIISKEDLPTEFPCTHCGGKYIQDSDTLDTWFSSGLWTFSTLGWPNEDAEDFKTFHPTSLLETGYDILFFWVARMILMTTYHIGDIPFKTVYLHGLVRDNKGKKMSKSIGNIIDPLEMISKYGADACRMSLIVGVGPGADQNLGEDKIKAYKKYSNKIWNIARFIMERTDGIQVDLAQKPVLRPQDEASLAELAEVSKYVDQHIGEYKLHLAADRLYQYTWTRVADELLEEAKATIGMDAGKDGQVVSEADRRSVAFTLRTILDTLLKLHHPFMPFITEELWTMTGERKNMLMIEKWAA